MIDYIGKTILVETFKNVMKIVVERVAANYFNDKAKKVVLVKAITKINQAILETKKFIRNEGYKTNTELSKFWHEALEASIAADLGEELPDFLYHKADYWGDPEEWNNNPSALEIVPKLKDLKELCDELMVQLKQK